VLAGVPITFLYPNAEAYLVHRRVQGLVPPYRADPIQFLEHLWPPTNAFPSIPPLC